MRVSIWQQFSSNHSSFFTVAGIFKTVELAEKATHELRSIIKTILS
jgi:hypothetical protein